MCKVNWCNNKSLWNGYCRKHYDQIRKYGNIKNERTKGCRNEYKYSNANDYAELNILNEDGSVKVIVKIDKEDIDKLSKYSFRYEKNHYIKCAYKGKTKYLHRIVMDYDGNLEIDHINRDKLDNRKCNLRIVDRKTNANNINRKETNGICKVNRNIKKRYLLQINKKYAGYYYTLEEAIMARNKLLEI